MGRPYATDLNELGQTYVAALDAEIGSLVGFVERSLPGTVIAIGSGGSHSVAEFVQQLHEASGGIARSMTPLEFASSSIPSANASLLFMTAGGRNPDILAAVRAGIAREPAQLLVVSTSPNPPAAQEALRWREGSAFSCGGQTVKDGFLATNSLLLTATLMGRAYGMLEPGLNADLASVAVSGEPNQDPLLKEVLSRRTIVCLYAGWGRAAAVDFESKLTEAGLANVQLADYRNFSHGRHFWLARNPDTTSVLALTTAAEAKLAERTLGALPGEIPRATVETRWTGPAGAIQLLVEEMRLVGTAGAVRNVDPGNPRVPAFGRRLYHLGFPSSLGRTRSSKTAALEDLSIKRKRGRSPGASDPEASRKWTRSYRSFVQRLSAATFGCILCDYDGTLCGPTERFTGPSVPVRDQINRILDLGLILGVATGRGKSVGADLRTILEESKWENVLIGYYNGSDIGKLSDLARPDALALPDENLKQLEIRLRGTWALQDIATYELRPQQLTVLPREPRNWSDTRAFIMHLLADFGTPDLQVLESSHSIDILPPDVSKVSLLRRCQELAREKGKPEAALCIGDRGRWPGNDAFLLATPYSLSVDSVSPDPETCWNIAPEGLRGVRATVAYLQSLEADGRGGAAFSAARLLSAADR